MGIISDGNSYGIDNDVCFSFPVICKDFEYQIVKDLELDEFEKDKLKATLIELQEEFKAI